VSARPSVRHHVLQLLKQLAIFSKLCMGLNDIGGHPLPLLSNFLLSLITQRHMNFWGRSSTGALWSSRRGIPEQYANMEGRVVDV